MLTDAFCKMQHSRKTLLSLVKSSEERRLQTVISLTALLVSAVISSLTPLLRSQDECRDEATTYRLTKHLKQTTGWEGHA